MKRKIVIIISLILVLIMLSLYYTYAVDITMEQTSGNADLTFNINITDNDGKTITVEAGKTKYFDIFVTNNNGGTINYGLAYTGTKTEGITIAQVSTSKNKVSELIEDNTTHQVSLIIINNTENDITYNIIPVTGYVKGGDLIVPEGYTLISDIYKEPSNLDTSGANNPKLADNMIPVMYNGSKWVKADSTNTNEEYKWYDYNNKQWANAVLISSTNRQTYIYADAGITIPEDDILAYYVWIPRYKYKVFNIAKTIGTDSYDAKNQGIDIVFEKGTSSTGTVSCNYNFAITNGSLSETCSGTNGEYYTHPAFTFGSAELTGIWVGKYEISAALDSVCYINDSMSDCIGDTTTLRIKPNTKPWRYNYLNYARQVIQNMNLLNNEYGLTTDTTKADSHMIRNLEWGAVAYFTNSKYGRCSKGECTEVSLNSYYDKNSDSIYKTGCGPQSNTSIATGNICNEYNSELGQLASTTGNVYGIYDMSGGAFEHAMGNMSSTSGTYTYFVSSAYSTNFTYSSETAKYIDTYAYGTTYSDQSAYNRTRLGDAIGEITTSEGYGWNDDIIRVAYNQGSYSWFFRGGRTSSKTDGGIFYAEKSIGNSSIGSARAVLSVIK